ncbi:MAG: P-II family nitrogen regulator [Rhodobacteraceae bacterium]|nr:P-II family nitrogen regulator [Paracoccaceae bacterium]
MKTRELVVLTDVMLITCVVQRGVADAIIKAAREAGAQGATVSFGKGMGVRERLGVLGVAVNVEKEVINIVVSTEQVDRVFEKMYLAGNLDTPGMGIMFTTKLEKAATFVPQDVLRRLADQGQAIPAKDGR